MIIITKRETVPHLLRTTHRPFRWYAWSHLPILFRTSLPKVEVSHPDGHHSKYYPTHERTMGSHTRDCNAHLANQGWSSVCVHGNHRKADKDLVTIGGEELNLRSRHFALQYQEWKWHPEADREWADSIPDLLDQRIWSLVWDLEACLPIWMRRQMKLVSFLFMLVFGLGGIGILY